MVQFAVPFLTQFVSAHLFVLLDNCTWNHTVPSHLQIASLRVQTGELGQEETVQKCLENGPWVEGLFDRFGELINQVQQACG